MRRWRGISLVNRQIFQAHAVFLVLTLALISALLLTCGDALLEPTRLSRAVLVGLTIFWTLRLVMQWGFYLADDLARTPLQHRDALSVFRDLDLRVDGVRGRALDHARLTWDLSFLASVS